MKTIELDRSKLDTKLLGELDKTIDSFDNPSGHVIPILHEAQHLFGYLPPALQLYVAEKTGLPAAHINGVVTFYSFFSEEPQADYNISVCLGTACFVKGSDKVLEAFSKELKIGGDTDKKNTDDNLFSLTDVRCVGACGLAPVVRVNDKIYGHVKPEDVPGIINEYRGKKA